MADEELHPILQYAPWWRIADPPPEVWRAVDLLGPEQQRKVGEILLNAHIAMAEARVAGLKQISQVISAGK